MSIEKKYELYEIKHVETQGKGTLQFFESEKDIPFAIKRIYYITGTPAGENRGMHAHKELKQFLFCPFGAVKLIIDDAYEKYYMILNKPDIGILLSPCLWRDMIWLRDNSVLCVAVSDYYSESDYIRNYDEFLKYVKTNTYEC